MHERHPDLVLHLGRPIACRGLLQLSRSIAFPYRRLSSGTIMNAPTRSPGPNPRSTRNDLKHVSRTSDSGVLALPSNCKISFRTAELDEVPLWNAPAPRAKIDSALRRSLSHQRGG